jgi:hypothetical protein
LGLLDRFRTFVSFADGNSNDRVPTGGSTELGVSGESILGGFGDTEANSDNLTPADYIKMRQNDGTIASMYSILTMPILASQYTIEADEEDAKGEQANFIRRVLLNPPHKGGMEIPMPIILGQMLQAVLEGFALFEKVYMISSEGKIVYKKLANRDSRTVFLIRAQDGGYGGAHQRTTFKSVYYDVEMPAWKTMLYTYGKDKNFLYGESAFKAAHYHYVNKHKLYYLANLSVQTSAVPPKVLSGPSNYGKPEKDRAMRNVEKLGGVRTTAYIPDVLTLTPYDSAKGRMDALPLIEHHNAEMARSALAQFLMLGTGSKSGSWALSKDHSDILLTALKGVMSSIEDHINHYLIPDLIDLNFANPAYPEWHFQDITSDAKDLVLQAFTQMVTSGVVSDEIKQGIEDRIAETLDFDMEQLHQDVLDAAKEKIAAAKAMGIDVDPQGNPLPTRQTVAAPGGGGAAKPGAAKPASKPINQSDEGAGVIPKVPERLPALRSGSTSDRFKPDWMP